MDDAEGRERWVQGRDRNAGEMYVSSVGWDGERPGGYEWSGMVNELGLTWRTIS